jgi:hypothetical protein
MDCSHSLNNGTSMLALQQFRPSAGLFGLVHIFADQLLQFSVVRWHLVFSASGLSKPGTTFYPCRSLDRTPNTACAFLGLVQPV